jgi:hypothetical protein
MPDLRAQVSFPAASGLPKDVVTNTWHFDAEITLDLELASMRIVDWLIEAYTGLHDAAVGRLSGFYSGGRNGQLSIKVYNLDDPEPRTPIGIGGVNPMPGWAASDDENLPDEVALCLSYKGAPVVGVPANRQRGRIYLGPFQRQGIAGSFERPGGELRTAAALAGQSVIDNSNADAELKWIVRSAGARNNGVSVGKPWEAGYVHPRNRPILPVLRTVVTEGWVDNAWDTQRSRGVAATGRTIF